MKRTTLLLALSLSFPMTSAAAPTMAKLLSIPFPGADGRVLEEALK